MDLSTITGRPRQHNFYAIPVFSWHVYTKITQRDFGRPHDCMDAAVWRPGGRAMSGPVFRSNCRGRPRRGEGRDNPSNSSRSNFGAANECPQNSIFYCLVSCVL
jgi:hypothetical protein